MPLINNSQDIYAADRAGALSPVVIGLRPLLYLPNSKSNSVDEIDPRTYRIVRHIRVGRHPERIVPSYDLKTLWVLNDLSNSITALDPRNGSAGRTIPVTDPSNMYFTPDGRYALVIEKTQQILAFRDAQTMTLVHQLPVSCPGVNRLDFTADGRYAVGTCESPGRLIKIDIARQQVVGYLQLGPNTSPQDIRTTPDGSAMYVADRFRGGIWKINPATFKTIGFLPTSRDAYGLLVGRDSRRLYITHRTGTVCVLTFSANAITHRWRISRSTPDIGGLSTDGKILWLTDRLHREIYPLNTSTGELLARIKVQTPPHDLTVYPQPGRYSLGSSGVLR